MTDAMSRVKAEAAKLRDGLARAQAMEAAERQAQAERAEQSVAARLPNVSDTEARNEFGLD